MLEIKAELTVYLIHFRVGMVTSCSFLRHHISLISLTRWRQSSIPHNQALTYTRWNTRQTNIFLTHTLQFSVMLGCVHSAPV